MAFRLMRHLAVSKSDALARIRARAGMWRESEFPPTLTQHGGIGISVRIDGDQFSIFVEANTDDGRAGPTLVGRVADTPDGHSVLSARVGYAGSPWHGGALLLAALGVFLVFSGALGTGLILCFGTVGFTAIHRLQDRAVRFDTNPIGQLIANRLDAALGELVVRDAAFVHHDVA